MLLLRIEFAVLLSLFQNSASESPQDALFELLKSPYTSANGTRFNGGSGEPLILTKYIEEGKFKEARDAARVDTQHLLPGIESYAGYFTVNKNYNANLFFWYFPVPNQKVEATPWIIWLQGGPGGSSLFGLFTEVGPYIITSSGRLEERKLSWGKNHSLLFIDNPVGTGFSFTDDERGYANNQTTIGENLYCALQQFLTIFSELRSAPLTIAGESYAGKHIPSLGIQIHWHRDDKQLINLKGLAIGNGFIDPVSLQRYSYFAREVGLISDHEADLVKEYEVQVIKSYRKGNMLAAKFYHSGAISLILKASGTSPYNYLKDDYNLGGAFVDFLNRDEIRDAIHVGSQEFVSLSDEVYFHLIEDYMHSAKPWLEELIQNYKVLCYNGHLDIVVAYHPSVNTYNSLHFPGSKALYSTPRHQWHHAGRVAGYFRTVGNFTELMVRGAGHMVPAEQPSAALGMISAFIRGQSLFYFIFLYWSKNRCRL